MHPIAWTTSYFDKRCRSACLSPCLGLVKPNSSAPFQSNIHSSPSNLPQTSTHLLQAPTMTVSTNQAHMWWGPIILMMEGTSTMIAESTSTMIPDMSITTQGMSMMIPDMFTTIRLTSTLLDLKEDLEVIIIAICCYCVSNSIKLLGYACPMVVWPFPLGHG